MERLISDGLLDLGSSSSDRRSRWNSLNQLVTGLYDGAESLYTIRRQSCISMAVQPF